MLIFGIFHKQEIRVEGMGYDEKYNDDGEI